MLTSTKVKFYLHAMDRRGFCSEQVLSNTALCSEQLERTDHRIHLAQAQVIIQNMLSLTGNPALGLELGLESTPDDMGIVGHGIIASPTFRDAIKLFIAYVPQLYGSLMDLQIEEDQPPSWSLLLKQQLPFGRSQQFCQEEYLAFAVNTARELVRAPLSIEKIQFDYPRPAYFASYQRLFNCPLEFDAPQSRLTLRKPLLDDFLPTRDEYLHSLYLQYCERQSQRLNQEGEYAYEVHNYLLKHLGREASLEKMACDQRLSTSTLRRRLRAEGQSFRDLHNQFRHDFALENLKGALSAKEVAYLLGYRDTKPFLRAFKSWTGMTVGEYKRHGR